MTETEYLLVCLAEECAETQHAVAKALRFGLANAPEGAILDNAAQLALELVDVLAVRELLIRSAALPGYGGRVLRMARNEKQAKVREHLALARRRWIVT